ncbi:unnamed protein product [Lampetra planeri]
MSSSSSSSFIRYSPVSHSALESGATATNIKQKHEQEKILNVSNSPLISLRNGGPVPGGGGGGTGGAFRPNGNRRSVAILGSGDFARALAARLLSAGYAVAVGSRDPKAAAERMPPQAELLGRAEAAASAALVVVALHHEHYATLAELGGALAGRVLVDVSNRSPAQRREQRRRKRGGGSGGGDGRTQRSNAEFLAEMFPHSHVVKAFNVVSAWALQGGPRDSSKRVPVCGDSVEARAAVMQLARDLGFAPLDMGALSSAASVEELPLRLFPLWRFPVLLCLALSLFFFLYAFVHEVVHPFAVHGRSEFYKIPVEVVNATLPVVALSLLALVYVPGALAAALQLWHATKWRHFPPWLDRWLRCRKQLGLLAFFYAGLHAIYSLALPLRRSYRYRLLDDAYRQVQSGLTSSWDEEQVWRMETYISLGIMALGLMVLLAITSLPSVSDALNWREFSFIQSKLGVVALAVSTLHALTFGWRRAFEAEHYHFHLPPVFVLALPLPCATLLARLLLALPCCSRPLERVRRGHEGSPFRGTCGAAARRPIGDITSIV